MAHRKDNPNRRGSLTLNERQRLRKNKKYGWNFIYRNGIKIDEKGYPINDRSSSAITDPTDPNYDPWSEGAGDEGPAELTEAEMKSYIWGFEKYGWDYIYRDGVKTDKEGNPMEEDKPVYSDEGDTLTSDDEGRFPGEPGYGKGADWKPAFQEPGMGEDGEGMPNDAELADLMNDANFDTGGNYIGPEGVGNAGEGNQDEPVDEPVEDTKGYGGRGYAQRTKGYNPFLKIKKQTKGLKGAFTRGSLRVKKLSGMTI